VSEAEAAAHCCLNREIESYLVFMLMRYIGRPELLRDMPGTEHLERITRRSAQQVEGLRDIGDQCRIFAGLFPEHAARRSVPISYFVQLGRSAYRELADAGSSGTIFEELSEQLVKLMDVLQTMRELDDGQPCLDPLSAIQLWHDTGSPHAWRVLKETTDCLPSSAAGGVH
jgi:hypothetical protein